MPALHAGYLGAGLAPLAATVLAVTLFGAFRRPRPAATPAPGQDVAGSRRG